MFEKFQKSICVYCGAKNGTDSALVPMAFSVGQAVAKNNYRLVYGGANVGLMGQIASGALKEKAPVLGIIPKVIFDFEVAHEGITQLITVNDMHERKLKMMEVSDAFLAIPGGFGTMDELNEIITWRQIKLHQKPIAIYNFNGYYNHYIEFIKSSVQSGLISKEHYDMLIISNDLNTIFSEIGKQLG